MDITIQARPRFQIYETSSNMDITSLARRRPSFGLVNLGRTGSKTQWLKLPHLRSVGRIVRVSANGSAKFHSKPKETFIDSCPIFYSNPCRRKNKCLFGFSYETSSDMHITSQVARPRPSCGLGNLGRTDSETQWLKLPRLRSVGRIVKVLANGAVEWLNFLFRCASLLMMCRVFFTLSSHICIYLISSMAFFHLSSVWKINSISHVFSKSWVPIVALCLFVGLLVLVKACGVSLQSVMSVSGIGGVVTAFLLKDVAENVLRGSHKIFQGFVSW